MEYEQPHWIMCMQTVELNSVVNDEARDQMAGKLPIQGIRYRSHSESYCINP